ncbi:conserved hypothetical protein [Ricinus communis]|uniref:Uncharacterized protein n=1 Tax=Ricinus communis TaxID=3988 RepID=B9RSL8_RICCO|nr:conserved hypothetical protein [Ricinus communis]
MEFNLKGSVCATLGRLGIEIDDDSGKEEDVEIEDADELELDMAVERKYSKRYQRVVKPFVALDTM